METSDAAHAKTVRALIAEVAAAVGDIPKSHVAGEKAGGYAYRSIDDIVGALRPHIASRGMVLVPCVTERAWREGTKGGTTVLAVTWTIWGPVDSLEVGPVWGEAYDFGDKGTTKALTAAYKAVLSQLFLIGEGESEPAAKPAGRRQKSAPAKADPDLEKLKQMLAVAFEGDTDKITGYLGRQLGRPIQKPSDLSVEERAKVTADLSTL